MSRMISESAASAAVSVASACLRGNSMHLTLEKVRVILDHVESRSRRRQSGDPVHPYHFAAARREGQRVNETPRTAVRCLVALTSLTSAYVFCHVDVLADSERKAQHERPGLGSPEVATERSVMALPEHLLA